MSWDLKKDVPRLRRAMDCAPSIFNQHPWTLRLAADDRVELYSVPNEDLGERLPREAVISCGAALYNLRLAIKVAGRTPSVWLLPGLDPESGLLTTVCAERTLLASVEVMPGRAARRATPSRSCTRRSGSAAPTAGLTGTGRCRCRSWWRWRRPPRVSAAGCAPCPGRSPGGLMRRAIRASAEIGTTLSGLRRRAPRRVRPDAGGREGAADPARLLAAGPGRAVRASPVN